jgi:very-short-patch-repair endonuclease
MPRTPRVPGQLAVSPFLGRDAVQRGLLTRTMLRGSAWVRLFPDIYVHREVPLTHQVWCQGAALILPAGGAVTELSAAFMWGVKLLPLGPQDQVSVAIPAGARLRRHPHLTIRQGTSLGADDVTILLGVPTTSPARTAFDLARLLPRDDAVIALDALLHMRKVSRAQLDRYWDAHPGWPGVLAACEALSLSDADAASAMETRLRLLIHDSGLPMPKAQVKIFNGRRFVARVDFAYEEIKLALEYEGDHHRERSTFRFDLERGNELRMLGWTVLRFTADDIQLFPDRVVSRVRLRCRFLC